MTSPSSECDTPRNSPVRGVAPAIPGVKVAGEVITANRRKSQQPQQQQKQYQDVRQRHTSDPVPSQNVASAFKMGESSTAIASVGAGARVSTGSASNTSTNASASTVPTIAANQQNTGGSEAKKSLVSMLCQSFIPMASVCTYRCKFTFLKFSCSSATNVRSPTLSPSLILSNSHWNARSSPTF